MMKRSLYAMLTPPVLHGKQLMQTQAAAITRIGNLPSGVYMVEVEGIRDNLPVRQAKRIMLY